MSQIPRAGSVATAKKNAARKRKNQAKIASSEPKIAKVDIKRPSTVEVKSVKAAKKRTKKTKNSETKDGVKDKSVVKKESLTEAEIAQRFPVLKNVDLVNKFLNITLTNNQKGRIRQQFRDNLKSTSDELLPDVIHNKIQTILSSSEHLTDTDLRKIRILYNMLKTATESETLITEKTMDLPEIRSKMAKVIVPDIFTQVYNEVQLEPKGKAEKKKEDKSNKEESKNKEVNKVKGPKRYVVFLGNLPLDVNKEKIISHFSDISTFIKDVRIPKPKNDEGKAVIAYLELKDEASFEMALSKHHSMLANKRINVMYTTQQNSKVTKSEAKGKASKMIALQKSGQLLGSVPANRKRSFRRNKLKRARAREQEA